MSYGRIQRQTGRRPAGPYDRPRNSVQPSPSSLSGGESSSIPFLSKIFNSVYGLFRPSQVLDECFENSNSTAEPSEERSDSPPRPPPPPAPRYEWQGVSIDEMAYGELKRVCLEEGLRVSEDRNMMLDALRKHIDMQKESRRPEGQNKRRLSNDNTSLDQIMMKKAKTGFSRDEFEKYLTLMKNNLKVSDDDFGKFSPGALSPVETPREIRRHSLPKRVPTPFAHISSRRPSRRDSFSGPGTIGPIHLSFPSSSTTAQDLHDLSNSSKTARTILSSISSMSTPLIQSNEILSKKRLQPRKPFNPYAQVGPAPTKPPFKVQPPVPRPTPEPVKASHQFDANTMLKKSREDSDKLRSSSPPSKRKAPSFNEPAHDAAKPISAEQQSAKVPAVPSSSQSFQFSAPSSFPPVTTSEPVPIPLTASLKTAAAPANPEEALCPVCELPLDDVDHSDCSAGESSPGPKPSAAPVSGFSFGKVSESSTAAGFSFQLPEVSETTKKDAAPNFSFGPPKPTASSLKFSFPVAPSSDSTQKQSQAPSSPPKFSFGQSDFVQAKSENKAPESKPPSSLFTSSSLTASSAAPEPSFPSVIPREVASGRESKQMSAEPSRTASSVAPIPSFSPTPSSGDASLKPDSVMPVPGEQQPTALSSAETPFKFAPAADQVKISEPVNISAPASSGFSFNVPVSSSAGSASVDVGKSSNSATFQAVPGFGFKFESKPEESSKGGSNAQQSSGTSFQFGSVSNQSAPAFQFGVNSSNDTSTPVANANSSAPSTFSFGTSTPSNAPQPNFSFGVSAPANLSFGAPAPSGVSAAPAFSFESSASKPPAPSSSGFTFGAADSSTAAASGSTFKFGVTDATSTSVAPASASSFTLSSPLAQSSQPSNSMQDSSTLTTNMASSTPTPAFGFGSNLATSTSGFGHGSTQTSLMFGQTPAPALPQTPAFGFGTGMKTSSSMDGFQSGSNLAFGQIAAPATPSSSFSFTPNPPSSTFVPSINFDAPVPDGLGGSFSHGMAPQGRPMVKAKRVARKR